MAKKVKVYKTATGTTGDALDTAVNDLLQSDEGKWKLDGNPYGAGNTFCQPMEGEVELEEE